MTTFIILLAIFGLCYAIYISISNKKSTSKSFNTSLLEDYNKRIDSQNKNVDNKKKEIEDKFNSSNWSPVNFSFSGLPYKFSDDKFTAFDFELADDNELSVVKLSIAHFQGTELLELKEFYFSPVTKFDKNANKFKYSNTHRITLNMVFDKPTIIDQWASIKQELNGKHLVAHNADYDLKILKKIIEETKSPLKNCTITCTSYYSKLFIKWMNSLKLNEICEEHKIPYWRGASKFKSVSTGVLFMYLSTICTEKSFNIFITGKKVNLNIPKT